MARLNHLHLHVTDPARSRVFYERWFGFCEKAVHGDILFLTDDGGFDLALAPHAEPANFPAWYHHGFRLATAHDVRELHARMTAAGVVVDKPFTEDETYATFRLRDPDGYGIEVYWE